MSEPVILVENLSKQYHIGGSQGKFTYGSLRDSLANAAKDSIHRLSRKTSATDSYKILNIWALKDVSFSVQRGETLGIIGRNGAGKSTLLKILSRITKPTEGKAIIRGRVGSLLEVGTGFHPELTGRENIYLNGSILGMQRREIEVKFDEIVSFSEIEKFLDTPVKYYSSGMYVRLAFAVAAHLEPEILLVDEVLAVGDMEFQKKCLGKMGEVADQGRTVLFVSHNMGVISLLCKTCFLLEKGMIEKEGLTSEVIAYYLGNDQKSEGEVDLTKRISSKRLMISSVTISDASGRNTSQIPINDGVRVIIKYKVFSNIWNPQIAFELWSAQGICILSTTDWDKNGPIEKEYLPGTYAYSCYVPPNYFRPGKYWLEVSSSIPKIEVLDIIPKTITFDVIDTGSLDAQLGHGRNGVISPILEWIRLGVDNSL